MSMVINILHWYDDYMNLYGESGNVKAIVSSLQTQGVEVSVDRFSLEDEVDLAKYDLIYMGSGTNKNQLVVLENMMPYQEQLNEYIEQGKWILATGNSFELFGKKIGEHEALGLLDLEANYTETRKVGDYIHESEYGRIIAFQNRGSELTINNEKPFIEKDIGVCYQNFYGTYLLGPLLVRNPSFHQQFIEKLIHGKEPNYSIQDFHLELDQKAYESYWQTYYGEKNIVDH